jgi:hypothetical protein
VIPSVRAGRSRSRTRVRSSRDRARSGAEGVRVRPAPTSAKGRILCAETDGECRRARHGSDLLGRVHHHLHALRLIVGSLDLLAVGSASVRSLELGGRPARPSSRVPRVPSRSCSTTLTIQHGVGVMADDLDVLRRVTRDCASTSSDRAVRMKGLDESATVADSRSGYVSTALAWPEPLDLAAREERRWTPNLRPRRPTRPRPRARLALVHAQPSPAGTIIDDRIAGTPGLVQPEAQVDRHERGKSVRHAARRVDGAAPRVETCWHRNRLN